MPTRIGPRKPLRLFIAEWREHRKLTQEQLAQRLGTSDVTISRWETRRRQPDLNAQAALAEALDIEPFDLRRHPDQPTEVQEQAIKLIRAIMR
jgi:transcriptional regulator with XRE-family HTH domain